MVFLCCQDSSDFTTCSITVFYMHFDDIVPSAQFSAKFGGLPSFAKLLLRSMALLNIPMQKQVYSGTFLGHTANFPRHYILLPSRHLFHICLRPFDFTLWTVSLCHHTYNALRPVIAVQRHKFNAPSCGWPTREGFLTLFRLECTFALFDINTSWVYLISIPGNYHASDKSAHSALCTRSNCQQDERNVKILQRYSAWKLL